MPVSCKLRNGKYRIVEPSGKIAKTKKGNAVDGGGHATKAGCQSQARAINRNLGDNAMNNTKENTAPLSACIFSEPCEVSFTRTDSDLKTDQFRITAYTGRVIPGHWLWGNIAFDLTGLEFKKKKTPVLEEHTKHKRIGFTTKQDISDKVIVEGNFLTNQNAQQIKQDITDGFPMQASLKVPPELVEHVQQGESVRVNGQVLKGPGTVFRKAKIIEVSMCSLGADSNTKSKMFAEDDKVTVNFNIIEGDQTMGKEQKTEIVLTAETFAADYPDLFAEITADAKDQACKETRELFGEFAKRFKGDPAFCIEQFSEGVSLEDATVAFAGKVKEELEKAKAKTIELQAEADKTHVDPAVHEFSDEQKSDKTTTTKVQTPEEKFSDEFNADNEEGEKIRSEFSSVETYIAYKKADAQGQVRIKSRG